MEVLSEIIRLFRMKVHVYHNEQICGNWLYREKEIGITCFHMVTKGECVLDIPGHFNTVLNYGDIVIFPHEIPHTMYPVNEMEGEQRRVPFHLIKNELGTGMLCGQAEFDHQGSSHLIDALPEVFLIRFHEKCDWSRNIVNLILNESFNPSLASDILINRLCEMLFIYAIRQFLHDHQGDHGLLALYSDKKLHKVLDAFHQSPADNWTLEDLAKVAGMSRTSFAEHFKTLSGWTPSKYLTWWRMQLAWSKLNEGYTSAQIAEEIGYKSEAAFSRAFQKQFGISAGKIRKSTT